MSYTVTPPTRFASACRWVNRRYLSWRYPHGYIRVHGVRYDGYPVAVVVPPDVKAVITDIIVTNCGDGVWTDVRVPS